MKAVVRCSTGEQLCSDTLGAEAERGGSFRIVRSRGEKQGVSYSISLVIVLGVKLRALHIPGKCFIMELYPRDICVCVHTHRDDVDLRGGQRTLDGNLMKPVLSFHHVCSRD